MCDGLSAASGVALSVLDPGGAVLVASGGQDVRTGFHRHWWATLAGCLASDLQLTERLRDGLEAPQHIASRGANGLWDVALPLIIAGEHLASVVVGQFFYDDDDDIDVEVFRLAAGEMGFDEAASTNALARVPVLSHERVTRTIRLLADVVDTLAEAGLSALQREQERETLRETEERYRHLFEAKTDAVFLIDNQTGRILEANSAASALYGYAPDELLALTSGDLSAEPERTQAVTHRTSLTADRVVTIPLRIHRKKDGSTFPLEITARFFTHRGRPVHMAAIRDISGRTLTEEALRLSEDKFSKAFHGSPDAILISRVSDGLVTDVNEGFIRLSGFTKDEAVGASPLTLRLWADPSCPGRGIPALRIEESRRDPELAFRVKSGAVLRCLVAGADIDVGGEPHVLTVVRDVSAERRAETAVRRSEALLRGILDNLQDAYLRTGLDGRLLMASPSAARMYGFDSPEEMIGVPAGSLSANSAARRVMHAELQARDQVVDYACRSRRKDGSTFWTSLNAQFYRDDEGNVAGAEGFVRDITERRHAEEEILRLNAELEQRVLERTTELEATNRELESFAYSVSHDLRAPLRALDGFSRILLDDYGSRLDDDGRLYLTRIRAADRHMGALIDALLELSRLNRGELQRERLDISALARSVAEELAEAEPGRTVELTIAEGLEALADRRLARALLANLLGNAWKFTGRHKTARIEVGAVETDGERALYVRDDGAGFDMAYADKLFGAFQRLHVADDFEGLGIGLATVQRIVRRHGGRVWAEGAIEKGATFFVTLPEAARGGVAAAGNAEDAPGSAGRAPAVAASPLDTPPGVGEDAP